MKKKKLIISHPGWGGGGEESDVVWTGVRGWSAKPVPIFKVILAEKGTHY